jgi:hypothetical protein
MLGRGSSRPQGPASVASLADIELDDATGEPVRLGSLWETRPAVLVFLRHYG